MNNSHCLSKLSQFILTNQSCLVDEWWEACANDSSLVPVGKLTREQFRNNIPAALEGFRKALVSDENEVLETIRIEVAKHGHHRWRQGFNLRELIRDWGHLNRTLLAWVERYFDSQKDDGAGLRQTAIDRLACFMTEATSGSVRRFDELRQEEALALEADIKAVEEQFESITRERSRILRETAHDLHGNLSALILNSRLFRDSDDCPATLEHKLDQMDKGLRSVSDMLHSLLDLTRLESGKETLKLAETNLVKLFHDVAEKFEGVAIEKEIRLLAEGTQPLWVNTDAEKIRRIAQNLLVNALQHTEEGYVKIMWEMGSGYWEMRVEDTGPGMQADKGSTVAQELEDHDQEDDRAAHTSHSFAYTGEGIGLTIVKRLCDLLHAGIKLHSIPGEGSTFTIQFPLEYEQEG